MLSTMRRFSHLVRTLTWPILKPPPNGVSGLLIASTKTNCFYCERNVSTSVTAWTRTLLATNRAEMNSGSVGSFSSKARQLPSTLFNAQLQVPTICHSNSITTSGQDSDDMFLLSKIDEHHQRQGGLFKKKKRLPKMDGKAHMKGVVLRTLIRKPRKPNSANRRCCEVRLENGKTVIARIPGEGHNLQEHNVVLVYVKKSQDLIGVHFRVVRGKYDCAPVVKRTQ